VVSRPEGFEARQAEIGNPQGWLVCARDWYGGCARDQRYEAWRMCRQQQTATFTGSIL